MKKEKIESLFDANSVRCGFDKADEEVMLLRHFTHAINQAELEWYKKLEKKLANMRFSIYGLDYLKEFKMYQGEIQNKIKELENER